MDGYEEIYGTTCPSARENDGLKQKIAALCKDRDELRRTLDQTLVRLNDETSRADALQRRCDDLKKSRQAWAEAALQESCARRCIDKGKAMDVLQSLLYEGA